MKYLGVVLGTALGIFGLVGTAAAELPAVVGSTLSSIQEDAMSAIDLVWPIMLAVFGGLLLMKLVKRAANKI